MVLPASRGYKTVSLTLYRKMPLVEVKTSYEAALTANGIIRRMIESIQDEE
jgi:hypothetical protein